MMLFLGLIALSVVAVVLVYFAEKHHVITPLRGAKTEANIRWVRDFNVSLGMKLDGLLGVIDVFAGADGENMLKNIAKYHNREKALIDEGKSEEEIATTLAEDVVIDYMPEGDSHNRLKCQKQASAVGDYITFYSQAIYRMKEDVAFRKWVAALKCTVYPDMMTEAVLKLALEEVER